VWTRPREAAVAGPARTRPCTKRACAARPGPFAGRGPRRNLLGSLAWHLSQRRRRAPGVVRARSTKASSDGRSASTPLTPRGPQYSQLSEALLKVLTERPDNAVEAFRQVLANVEKEATEPTEPIKAANAHLVEKYSKGIARLHKSEADEEGEGENGSEDATAEQSEETEPLPPPRGEVLRDFESDMAAWAAAGIVLESGEALKLHLSLARLAGADTSIASLRLWGKFLGRHGVYFVAEGSGGEVKGEEDEEAEQAEEKANKFNYWVCSFPGDSWTLLPQIRPSTVVVARQIRRFLTGRLDASVQGYPAFPGTEKDFVRAQIALINQECAIAPKSYFTFEEGGDVELNEEFAMPAAADLMGDDSWEQYGSAFSAIGRVDPVISEDEEGNEVSNPPDWTFTPLRDVNMADWDRRVYPRTIPEASGTKVVLRSRRWPGAYAVASPATKSWTNFYVGFGQSRNEIQFTPPMPPPIQKEADVSGLKEQEDVVEDPNPPENAEEVEE